MTSEEMIRAVLEKHPTLTANGFDVSTRKGFQACRDHLLHSQGREEFEAARDWLSRVPKVQRCRYSSYFLKHCAEEWSGEYVSNGAFIAAAFCLGFKVSRRSGLNAGIGVGASDKWPASQSQALDVFVRRGYWPPHWPRAQAAA